MMSLAIEEGIEIAPNGQATVPRIQVHQEIRGADDPWTFKNVLSLGKNHHSI